MHFTKVQITELMRKHAEKENGLHDLMEIMLESMMVAERSEFLRENPSNKGNGYRPGHAYGQGRKLEFRIPRDRYGNFHPQILAILRDQEEECDRLAGALYTKGLTQEQVGDVLDQIYQNYAPEIQSMIYTTNWIGLSQPRFQEGDKDVYSHAQ